jgi:hypothetical protein
LRRLHCKSNFRTSRAGIGLMVCAAQTGFVEFAAKAADDRRDALSAFEIMLRCANRTRQRDVAIRTVAAFAASNCVAPETFRKHDCRFLH